MLAFSGSAYTREEAEKNIFPLRFDQVSEPGMNTSPSSLFPARMPFGADEKLVRNVRSKRDFSSGAVVEESKSRVRKKRRRN